MATTFTLAALVTELATDPKSMGYASVPTANHDAIIAVLLNAKTGPGAESIFRCDVAVEEVINAIVAADFATLNVTQLSKLTLMLSTGELDTTLPNVRQIFLGIFTGMTATITALTAVAQRTGSRAEVLWGCDFSVTEQHVGQARNGV